MKANIIPNKLLRECFEYSEESSTGLIWIQRPFYHFKTLGLSKRFNDKCKGKEAGTYFLSKKNNNGYYSVAFTVKGKKYQVKAHRIVYSLYHDVQLTEDDQIDHKDWDGTNNHIDNLRLCNIQQNNFNVKMRKDNTTGYTGVCKTPRGTYVAYISINGKVKNLGANYITAYHAYQAYKKAAIKQQGEFISKHK